MIALLVLACGGGAFWAARKQSLLRCRKASFLASQTLVPARWFEAAVKDRFQESLLRQGAVGEAIAYYREEASVIANDPLLSYYFPEAKARFTQLVSVSPTDEKTFLEALLSVAALSPPAECEPAEDATLLTLYRGADHAWQLEQEKVRSLKASFAADLEIYCLASALQARLKLFQAATEERCASTERCAQTVYVSISQEIADIEKQKEFNLQKLRRKWPEEILEGLKCS